MRNAFVGNAFICNAFICTVLGAILLFSAAVATAGEGAGPGLTDAQAKAAVAALDETLKKGTGAECAAAVRSLGANDHRLVSDRLVAVALDDQAIQDVRAAAFECLSKHEAARSSVRNRLSRWVAKQSEADADLIKRGDIGVPLDRRTGDAIAKGPAYEAAVKAASERASWVASAVRCLATFEAPTDAAATMRPFLQSAYDELAVAAIEALGAWKAQESVPDLLFLFRMYPRDNRWETSAVAHIGGSNSSAKAEWMRYFGHPLKQRARPDVHRAIRASVLAITGHKVASPEELDGLLASDPGSRKKSR